MKLSGSGVAAIEFRDRKVSRKNMGRKPIGKKAMTAAERQRRRRARLRKEKLKLGCKAEKERKHLKAAERYIPTPPGITHWIKVRVGDREVWSPTTQPLPSMRWDQLRDEDLRSLIEQAQMELNRRAGVGKGPGGGIGVCE
jgi:hypothetical protein